jgi:hypothetical protein
MFKKSIEALQKFDLNFKPSQSFEFFFYTDSADAASNLSIALHQLGYTLYEQGRAKAKAETISIIGHTTPLETSEAAMDEWWVRMEQLAEENHCRFDGWGSLIEP